PAAARPPGHSHWGAARGLFFPMSSAGAGRPSDPHVRTSEPPSRASPTVRDAAAPLDHLHHPTTKSSISDLDLVPSFVALEWPPPRLSRTGETDGNAARRPPPGDRATPRPPLRRLPPFRAGPDCLGKRSLGVFHVDERNAPGLLAGVRRSNAAAALI